MTPMIVPEHWLASTVDFSQLAIPSVLLLLVAIVLRTMLTYARGPHIERVKTAATLVIAPLSFIFAAAMFLRVSSVLGQ